MNAKKKATPQITPSAVRQAATALIQAEGSTTTITVSQFLRNRGYWSYQSELVSWLADAAAEEGWTVTDNGMFRVYSLPTYTAVAH
ncbi:hypothetical protein [Spirosoma sp. KUDC1026]|uniref:hypothetical protein n=1 Tax=Spirosoma sp. KUDC1026 TaxID=2745947 RepID=UPI00159BAC69|nr:hypothetical protein [Spirosoma sp. KUDC1026]QKZ12188.1 hypothetical protein HU175_05925 [Spirosoma sp. KUDC1026]